MDGVAYNLIGISKQEKDDFESICKEFNEFLTASRNKLNALHGPPFAFD